MIEQTLVFGPQAHLVGTACLPERGKARHEKTMVLLTNAGVIPRIGPHRVNVRLARRLADLGLASFRFDLSGLGDSRRSSSRLSTGEQFIADTISAMDAARSEFGCAEFVMVGFCSGGDVAYNVALEDARLRGIVLWDSYVYPTGKAKLKGLFHRLRRHSLSSLASKLAQRVVALGRQQANLEDGQATEGPSIFGRSQMPARDVFGQSIRSLVDRGVEVMFLYSGGEPEWYNYEAQFREMFAPYGFVDRVEYDYLIRNDHTFIQPRSQDALIDRVEHWLERRALPSLRRESIVTPQAAAPLRVSKVA